MCQIVIEMNHDLTKITTTDDYFNYAMVKYQEIINKDFLNIEEINASFDVYKKKFYTQGEPIEKIEIRGGKGNPKLYSIQQKLIPRYVEDIVWACFPFSFETILEHFNKARYEKLLLNERVKFTDEQKQYLEILNRMM